LFYIMFQGSNGKAEHQQNPGSLGRTMINNPS
jgi:hypothetical protein